MNNDGRINYPSIPIHCDACDTEHYPVAIIGTSPNDVLLYSCPNQTDSGDRTQAMQVGRP